MHSNQLFPVYEHRNLTNQQINQIKSKQIKRSRSVDASGNAHGNKRDRSAPPSSSNLDRACSNFELHPQFAMIGRCKNCKFFKKDHHGYSGNPVAKRGSSSKPPIKRSAASSTSSTTLDSGSRSSKGAAKNFAQRARRRMSMASKASHANPVSNRIRQYQDSMASSVASSAVTDDYTEYTGSEFSSVVSSVPSSAAPTGMFCPTRVYSKQQLSH
jgi:hypothetical protein